MFAITGFYAAIMGFMLIWLSFRVILKRKALRVPHGTAGDDQLNRRRNAHSNFAEYVPIILALMALAEGNGTNAMILHTCGTLLLAGRIIHATGLTSNPENLMARQIGMILTFLSLIIAAAINLMYAVIYLMA